MNLVHLRYALEVQRAGSISKAAENLYMGQPNLSKAIKELELSLGIRLFKRAATGVMPTPEGQAYLEKAQVILDQITELESAYGISSAMKLILPRLPDAAQITAQCKRPPVFAATPEVIRRVSRGEFTLGLIRYPESEEALYVSLLRELQLKLHPLRAWSYAPAWPAADPAADRLTLREAAIYAEMHVLLPEERALLQALTQRV